MLNPISKYIYAGLGVVILALGIYAGWKTIQVANRDTTIAEMKAARDKEVAEALSAEIKYKDQDRKNNERLEESYLSAKAELDALRNSSNTRIVAAGNNCPAVLDAVLDGVRGGYGVAKSGPVPAGSAAPNADKRRSVP